MFKLFQKNNFLEDLWKNFQILLSLNSQENNHLKISSKSGLLVSTHNNNEFTKNIRINIKGILNEGDSSTETNVEVVEDSSDMHWLILEDKNIYDLMSSCYTTLNALHSKGSLPNILALVIKLEYFIQENEKSIVNLIYRTDTKSFYPFIPISQNPKSRNKDLENKLAQFLRKNKLKIESSTKSWLGVWGIPF
ncbi:MAG: hypothetical protein CL772_01025 [Chloroflexi bacterium]|nr:hypothetical protein [Chloroflexota bacterium]